MSEILVYRKKDVEMSYAIVNEYDEYIFSIKPNYITLTPDLDLAMLFYNESSAYEMALELQVVTNRWFGVVEI